MTRADRLVTPVLVGGSAIILISYAIRASFGLFQIPIADDLGWLRAEFSMAIAIQNLAWGIGQPVFGAIAERFGDRKAITLGVAMYVAGLAVSAYAVTPGQHQLLEMFVGFGVAGTGFGVILAMVGRAASDRNRSLALGIATAAGSAGQVVGPPLAEFLLSTFPWQTVFLIFAGAVLVSLLFLPMLRPTERPDGPEMHDTLSQILRKAARDPSFSLIFVGFFSCGYQVAFFTAHFPAFISDNVASIPPDGLLYSLGITTTSALGALAIALIGLANIGGTLFASYLGRTYSRKYLLAWIYAGRTFAAAAFILLPVTPLSVIVFSVVMGSLWLATVPLTGGLVGYIYGLKYMGTLYGIVFFSHQLGSFTGVWLGGVLYDLNGSYALVWWVGIGVGALSAILHLPIREIPLGRRDPRAA